MGRGSFQKLCESLDPYIGKRDTIYRKAISLGKRVAVALFFLKSGTDYGTIADLFGIVRSTVSALVLEFCDAMIAEHQGLISFPDTEEEKEAIANNYFQKWQYYDCFGAMDGTHIPIQAPHKDAEDYYCYKCFHSMNVLALVDDKYLFR